MRSLLILIGLLCAIAFHFAMKADAERLCETDATAYEGC